MNDKNSRIAAINLELQIVDKILSANPLDASANARYKYLETLLNELMK